MKKIVMTVTLGLLLSLSVSAAQIYGTLKEDQRALPANLEIEVICNGQPYKGKTDSNGAYSINVGKGRCTFKLFYKDQTIAFDKLYSSDNPLRYDFDLVKQNGEYRLQRR